jgi:hypothetical protein
VAPPELHQHPPPSSGPLVKEIDGYELALSTRNSVTGYSGVKFIPNQNKPFLACYGSGGHIHLGNFATAVEAALAVAKYKASGKLPPPQRGKRAREVDGEDEEGAHGSKSSAPAHDLAQIGSLMRRLRKIRENRRRIEEEEEQVLAAISALAKVPNTFKQTRHHAPEHAIEELAGQVDDAGGAPQTPWAVPAASSSPPSALAPSSAPSSAPCARAGEVRAVLKYMSLEQYAPAFMEHGHNNLLDLARMEDNQASLDTVTRDAQMKPGHAQKFKAWLKKAAEHVLAAEPSIAEA